MSFKSRLKGFLQYVTSLNPVQELFVSPSLRGKRLKHTRMQSSSLFSMVVSTLEKNVFTLFIEIQLCYTSEYFLCVIRQIVKKNEKTNPRASIGNVKSKTIEPLHIEIETFFLVKFTDLFPEKINAG